MEPAIREIRDDDLDEWVRMRVTLWPDCADDIHRVELAEQRSEGHQVFVLDRGDGTLGGFLEASVRSRVDGSASERVGYIEGWWIDPDLRARGLGRRLVERAERWTRDQGLDEIASDAEIDNQGSIEAHAALGFRETFRVVQFLKKL